MSNINLIKELRAVTGLSFSEIKKALAEAGGDRARTIQLLQSLGATVAEKKAARATEQGMIDCYVHATKKIGAMVVLLCETDFVAKNPLFAELAHALAMHIAAMEPADGEALLSQPFIKDQTITVQQLIQQSIAKLGENIKVRTFSRYQI